MKLLLLTVFVAFALAEEATEEAKAEAPAVPTVAVHPFYGLWGHQLQWPGIRAPGFSATCFGCRGKRSAEAEADAEPGYYGYPYYGYGPYYGHGYGYALPGHSYTHVHRFGKRSAEADAEPGYYGYPYPYYGYRAYGPGIAGHPSGTSYVHRSPQGLGK